MSLSFVQQVRKIIKKVPKGKVATYGQIAALSGNPRNARMIAGILHRYSEKENLPWHRIINSQGKISLGLNDGYKIQKSLLESEGIVFKDKKIDLNKFQWSPRMPIK